jgi:DNA polymerase III delta subunit
MSFLAEKKLIIIELEIWTKESKINDKIDYIITLIDKLPEWNILLLYSINPDKRSKQYKYINKIAELREFNSKSADESYSILRNRFSWKISDSALQKLIAFKSNNIEKIASEIEKLLITKNIIEVNDITDNIFPELEESIFQFIDDILNRNLVAAKLKLNIILNDTSIYAFYNNLLANLRTNVFIWKLKSQKKSQSEIAQILDLWNKAFLINKSYKLSFNKLSKFYIELIWLDKKMKSWKLMWTEDKDFLLEFENILLKIN